MAYFIQLPGIYKIDGDTIDYESIGIESDSVPTQTVPTLVNVEHIEAINESSDQSCTTISFASGERYMYDIPFERVQKMISHLSR